MGEEATSPADRELRDAAEALSDARLLLDGGGSINGTVNRLYYACFHAARAVVYDRGGAPTTHGDVRSQFGERVVLAGDAPREMGRLLSDLYDHRAVADYEGTEPDVDAAALLTDVEAFVERAVTLVEAEPDDE